MTYPSLQEYNEALQHPEVVFADPDLRNGDVAKNPLGLPQALCGGFALTYKVATRTATFAVRCFHKPSVALDKRYGAISRRLHYLRSPYFVDFEFQPQGIRINGGAFPIVKMAWASGDTLGECLEGHHHQKNVVQHLNSALRALAMYLESQNLAHGDIQPGNLMVSNGGRAIQLIDYDGIYLDELKGLGSAEIGHRNFQHPARKSSWNPGIDRFSFIILHLAMKALEVHPEWWSETDSDGDSVLLKANDFANPGKSLIWSYLFSDARLADDARNFAVICKAGYNQVPSLEEFIEGRNIPRAGIPVVQATRPQYIPAFPVLDAKDYESCLQRVGDRVELIGQIVGVKRSKTRHGRAYTFINFAPWQGNAVRINIWSEGLASLKRVPDHRWAGKWVSVVGLMETPYRSERFNYCHLSISLRQDSQIHVIPEDEAKFRLSGTKYMRRAARALSAPNAEARSANEAVLQRMKCRRTSEAIPSTGRVSNTPAYTPASTSGSPGSTGSKCIVATAVYGENAAETNALRAWRDRVLIFSVGGRAFLKFYYEWSPRIVPLLGRSETLTLLVRVALKWFVRWIEKQK